MLLLRHVSLGDAARQTKQKSELLCVFKYTSVLHLGLREDSRQEDEGGLGCLYIS